MEPKEHKQQTAREPLQKNWRYQSVIAKIGIESR
jgi:hypothetical protein